MHGIVDGSETAASGPRTLVLAASLSPDGNILTVVAKRFRWRNFCSSPRRKHPQCLRQTLPLRGSIATARFHWYKSQRILRHFSPEQHEV